MKKQPELKKPVGKGKEPEAEMKEVVKKVADKKTDSKKGKK